MSLALWRAKQPFPTQWKSVFTVSMPWEIQPTWKQWKPIFTVSRKKWCGLSCAPQTMITGFHRFHQNVVWTFMRPPRQWLLVSTVSSKTWCGLSCTPQTVITGFHRFQQNVVWTFMRPPNSDYRFSPFPAKRGVDFHAPPKQWKSIFTVSSKTWCGLSCVQACPTCIYLCIHLWLFVCLSSLFVLFQGNIMCDTSN